MLKKVKGKARSVIRQEMQSALRESLDQVPENKNLTALVRRESKRGAAAALKTQQESEQAIAAYRRMVRSAIMECLGVETPEKERLAELVRGESAKSVADVLKIHLEDEQTLEAFRRTVRSALMECFATEVPEKGQLSALVRRESAKGTSAAIKSKKTDGHLRSLVREEARGALRTSLEDTPEKEQLSELVRAESAKGISDAWKTKQAFALRKKFLAEIKAEMKAEIKAAQKAANDADTFLEAEEKNMRRRFEKALEEEDPEKVLRLSKLLAKRKNAANAKYTEMAADFRGAILMKKENEGYKESLKTLFMAHDVDEVKSDQLADIYRFHFPLMQASSLRLHLIIRRRIKQVATVPERWLAYDKSAGYEFAGMAGVRYPVTEEGFTSRTLPRKSDIIIKPNKGRGSIATYLVHSEDEIISVADQRVLHSREEMLTEIDRYLSSGMIPEDAFVIQEAIYGNSALKTAPHDMRFYAFYGDIPVVRETVKADPEDVRSGRSKTDIWEWVWDEKGELIRDDNTPPDDIVPFGVTPEMWEEVRQLSLKIPAPYVRIDYLLGENKMYFSEFTMTSGRHGLEWRSEKMNRILGTAYLKAEMRIQNDLLEGKTFPELCAFNRKYDAISAAKKAAGENAGAPEE